MNYEGLIHQWLAIPETVLEKLFSVTNCVCVHEFVCLSMCLSLGSHICLYYMWVRQRSHPVVEVVSQRLCVFVLVIKRKDAFHRLHCHYFTISDSLSHGKSCHWSAGLAKGGGELLAFDCKLEMNAGEQQIFLKEANATYIF